MKHEPHRGRWARSSYTHQEAHRALAVEAHVEGTGLSAAHWFAPSFLSALAAGAALQEALGYQCVDAGFVSGKLGRSIEGALLMRLRKKDLTPMRQRIMLYSEEDLFDVIEFLFDHCSKPLDRHYHNYDNCGWHSSLNNPDAFDQKAGRAELQSARARRALHCDAPHRRRSP